MAILKISEQSSGSQQAAEIARTYPRPLTLAELFLLGPGLKSRLLLTSDSVGGQASWQTALMPLVNICAQLLWPRCSVPTFQGMYNNFLMVKSKEFKKALVEFFSRSDSVKNFEFLSPFSKLRKPCFALDQFYIE